ncbi:MAG: FG-GAP-like repeat-containing protein [Planctomycetota bacterium]
MTRRFRSQPHRILPFLTLATLASAQGFVDRTADLGIAHACVTGFDGMAETGIFDWTQRGFAFGDIDNDLDVDIVLCGGLLTNTVLRNDDGVFTDISDYAGIEVGEFDSAPALADYDDDGDLDLIIGVMESGSDGLVTLPGASRLYQNDGTGRFQEATALSSTVGKGQTLFVQWVDFDLDGLVDLIFAEFHAQTNLAYRNNGDGTFTDVSAELGLDLPGSTHVTCVLDADDDGYLDVCAGNDYIAGQYLPAENHGDQIAHGQADGTWLNVSAGSGFDHVRGIMGFAIGDVNYDGRLDVYKSDANDNRMSINEGWPGGGAWHDEQEFYGVAAATVPDPEDPKNEGRAIAWGCTFQDFNFDLWLDLFLVNGQVAGSSPTIAFSPRNQRNFLFTGDGPGSSFTFSDATQALGLYDENDDRAMAVADVDRDGDLDILIGSTVGPVRYFENQIDPAGQGWLMVRPVCRTSARGGFGVKASFTDSFGYPHLRQVGLDGPTASQHENFAYFGLGTEPAVDLTVEFPSGLTLLYPGTTPNQVLYALEPELVRTNARTIALGAVAPPAGLAGKQPTTIATEPALAVTAFAHDQNGNPINGVPVTIEVPGLAPSGPVQHLQANQYVRYFAPPAGPGSYRAQVSFDGWEVKIRPRVHFYDPRDASGTTGTVRPEAVRAGSTDTVRVLIAPKTADGIALGPGQAVEIGGAGLDLLAGPTDLGDGLYSAVFAAPIDAGLYPLDVTVNGELLSRTEFQIEAGGQVVGSSSTMLKEKPNQAGSAAPNLFKLLLDPRDENSLRCGPNLKSSIIVTEDDGSAPITVLEGTYEAGQPDGEYLWILAKPANDPAAMATGVVDIIIDGLTFSTTYSF